MENIVLRWEGKVGLIQLNRPEKRNALSPELVAEVSNALDLLSGKVRCVVLTGSGNSFCAGADLGYIKKISEMNIYENLLDANSLANLYLKIFNFDLPVIAMVNGYALAGGCGLATVCDFIIASKSAKFGYPEVKIGFIPAIVSVFLVSRVSGGIARELLTTGRIVDAEEALKFGLVNRVVPDDELESFTLKFANELIESVSPEAFKLTKKLLNRVSFMGVEDAVKYALGVNTISRFTEDCRRGINAFLNKEKVRW